MSTESPTAPKFSPLADPALRKQLEDFVRRRVPVADVDDVVQTVLCDALAARERPEGVEELRRWVLGIARHKVVDLHRRAHKEPPSELDDLEASPPPIEERGLVEWAERQAGSSREGQKTLGWMAREGEGEKLESIAAEEKVPAARVRKRVSRMRKWMKERWLAELAAVAAIAVLAFVVWRWLSQPEEVPEAKPEKPVPSATPELEQIERGRALRAEAMKRCDEAAWQPCLDGLDAAKALDPAGDASPEVGSARDQAARGLTPPPAPSSTPDDSKTAAPKSSLAPKPTATVDPEAMAKAKAMMDQKKAMEEKAYVGKKAPPPAPKKPTGKMAPTKSGSDDSVFSTPSGASDTSPPQNVAPATGSDFKTGGGKK
jgi:DNA-directed RNA polymerase specialized sigma24 family protein